MPIRQMRLAPAATDDVSGALAALRAEVGLPAMFPQDVLEEARAAVENGFSTGRADRRDIEFVTIDPPGSKDLDQAVHVEQSGEGYVVHYAIADVGAFVTPGGALDAEAHRRGMTVYGPDARTPLHPKVLSEGAASLLPEEDRPAVLWTVTLDARGIIKGAALERAFVRSRERLTYAEVQSTLDAGTASESLQLLADVGRLRQSLELARGGVSLSVPEQEVERREDGTYTLSFRRNLPVEDWNAQISLLTGIAAAHLMRDAGVGILRTLPEADPRDLARLHRTARALGIDWPDSMPYAKLVPTLVSRIPEHAAFLNEATTLFRGAGYVAFGMRGPDGAAVPPPENTRHAAIAADYAHVTAPLRRLVDRYATEVCLAVSAGRPVPEWVLAALPGLPAVMAETGRRSSSFERECVNIVEASLLADRLGEEFDAVVVDVDQPDKELQRGEVVLRDPAVRARVVGKALPLGDEVRVQLAEADVAARRVTFTLGGPFAGLPGPAASRSRDAGSRSGGGAGATGAGTAGGAGANRAAGTSGAAGTGGTGTRGSGSGSGAAASAGAFGATGGTGAAGEPARGRRAAGVVDAPSRSGRRAARRAAAAADELTAQPVDRPVDRAVDGAAGSMIPDGPAPSYGAPAPSYAEPAASYSGPAQSYAEPAPAPETPAPMFPPSGSAPLPTRRAAQVAWREGEPGPRADLDHDALLRSEARFRSEVLLESEAERSYEPQFLPSAQLRPREQQQRWPEPVASHEPWQAAEAGPDTWQQAPGPDADAWRLGPEPVPGFSPDPRPGPSPEPSPSPQPSPVPRPIPRPRPQPAPQQPQPPAARPLTSDAPHGAQPDVPRRASADVPRRARRAEYPPMSRPVRPQVRDEMPLSEPWPRHAPAGRPLSQPVPTVRTGAQPHVVQVARYPSVSSQELPMVVAADLLAVEGRAPDGYRY
ncbi:RNB domain-containing ribonuclease [Promicromonospora sukumoe]|uniref:RNB domain-containing ribonuclease n=1 Tax=Promicromonospora sukumoe TaxID=88382 RepID=UPI0003A81237